MEFDRKTGVRHDIEESWDNDTDGTGFFSNATYSDEEVDGDLFSYTPDEYARGYTGKPHKFNWKKSGVLDVDCFLCHADRQVGSSDDMSVRSGMWYADNPTPANPRVFVFEKKDADGNVVEISLGFPPSLNATEIADNYTIDSANFYSNPLGRIVSLYYGPDIVNCLSNINATENLNLRILVAEELTEYIKRGMLSNATAYFDGLINLRIYNPEDNSTICTFNATTAPDLGNFTRTFFLDPGAPNFSARDYLRNAFYESATEGQPYVDSGMFLRITTMSNNFTYDPTNSTVPFVRLARAGFFFGWADSGTLMGVSLKGAINSDNETLSYYPLAFVRLEKQSDGTFKAVTYYAKLAESGDDSGEKVLKVNLPILETGPKTGGHYTLCSADSSDEDGVAKIQPTVNKDDALTYMCAQCHFAMPDEKNVWPNPLYGTPMYNQLPPILQKQAFPSWYVRRGIIGMGADVVKRGAVFSRESEDDNSTAPIAIDSNGEIANSTVVNGISSTEGLPIGYDVHFDKDKGDLSCLSCHGQDNLSEEEKAYHNPHNFLKGNDPAGEVDPALDYNPSLQTCVKCHWGSEAAAATAHEPFFMKVDGENTAYIHLQKIECQVCHIPYKTYWTFRFFNDLVGYSNNFDNRFRTFNSDGTIQQFPPEWAIPAFAPTYGVNFAYTITQTTDNGGDVVVPMTMIDMDPYRALMRWNDNGTMFGMWATGANPLMKPYLFPYRWAPVIVKRYTIDDNGNQVLRAGLINPIIVATWMDASTNRVLYIRELNAAVEGFPLTPSGGSTIDPENDNQTKEVPGLIVDNNTGKVCVKLINNSFVCDDDGDMVPEIDTETEYEAMKDALKQVLESEGEKDPNPVMFIGMAPFGIDHGVLPAGYALGSHGLDDKPLSCKACHSDDPSKSRLSPEVYSGDATKGRFITLVPFGLPSEAIEDAKKYGGWKLPFDLETKTINGKTVMGATQGAFMNFVSVPVESKEYVAYALATPGKSDSVMVNDVTISYPAGSVDTPTLIKVEKVEDGAIEESLLDAAKSLGVQTPVIAGGIYRIETKDNRFNLPVTFTLPYSVFKVTGKVLLLKSEDGKHWSVITSQVIDPQSPNPYISFSTTELSYFAVVGPASTEVSSITVPEIEISNVTDNQVQMSVSLPGIGEREITVSVEGASIPSVTSIITNSTSIEEFAKDNKLSVILVPPVELEPDTNATSITVNFENVPLQVAGDVEPIAVRDGEKLPYKIVSKEESALTVSFDLSSRNLTRGTSTITVALGIPSSSYITTSTNTASGGGGGCSLAPATTASSGLASFGAMLSGLLGLMFGRRRKKKQ
ncbi:hypothetical protein [Desulfurobacterium pacificum]|uniref:hypothetical protein n=1 Tax=Desulfurobacterium pacificum TaxID=240166 RepID=UPI0024B85C70|nr:hypothetical protein [Desulfurobacterium pacificum]